MLIEIGDKFFSSHFNMWFSAVCYRQYESFTTTSFIHKQQDNHLCTVEFM